MSNFPADRDQLRELIVDAQRRGITLAAQVDAEGTIWVKEPVAYKAATQMAAGALYAGFRSGLLSGTLFGLVLLFFTYALSAWTGTRIGTP